MKKIVLIALIAISTTSCKKTENASSKINKENATKIEKEKQNIKIAEIKFDSETHDFGDVKKGVINEHEFTITNTGEVDLIILEAKASCGCTVPEKPNKPVKPGESTKLKVAFTGKSVGKQSKSVTVKSNTAKSTTKLTIKANVLKK